MTSPHPPTPTGATVGTDLLEIDRVRALLERMPERALHRFLTERERAQTRHPGTATFLAGRIAAKEAVYKAIYGYVREGIRWQWIEIVRGEDGRPLVSLHGSWSGLLWEGRLTLSISHTHTLAQAVAVYFPGSDAK